MKYRWLFPFILAIAATHATAQFVLDRTTEPLPLLITQDLDWSGVKLVDNNVTRPAVIITKGTFNIWSVSRTQHLHEDPLDPGLGNIYNDVFLPKLKITFSHHDFDRAAVVCMGDSSLDVKSISSTIGVLVLPNGDGTPGKNQHITLEDFKGRFGVMASGQGNINVQITNSTQLLYSTGAPGHTFYANEARNAITGEYLRLRSPRVRIGIVRGVSISGGRITLDNVTAKFKGSWGVDYECLDDANPCGAFDSFGSSGVGHIIWKHTGASSQNQYFTAFRLGGEGTFGPPDGKMILFGSFDARLAPDQTLKIGQVETPLSGFASATFAGVQGPMVYPNCDVRGFNRVTVVDN